MTVPAQTPVTGPTVADGVTRSWPFTFKLFSAGDVKLRITDADGSNPVTVSAGFTVDPQYLNNDAGGYIVYPIAPADVLEAGREVTAYRDVQYAQSVKIGNQGGFFPLDHERMADYLGMQVQQIAALIGRALVVPFGETPPDPDDLLDQITLAIAAQVAADASAVSALASQLLAAGYASDAVSQGNVPIYSLVQGISALTIPVGITAFRTNGYAAQNDGGAWPLVVEVTNTGTLQPWQRQSNGGTRRWQLACAEPWIEMFGGKADAVYTASAITSGTDNLQPFYDMVAYSKATYGGTLPILPVVFGAKSGAYRFTDHVNVKAAVHIKCLANSGSSGPVTSSCVFPPDSAGFIFHRADTIDFVKETVSTGQADGSIWEGPRVLGTGGTSDLGYGIQLRCRVELRNPLVHNFSFAGVYIVATSGSGVAARQGNANYWRARGGRITGSRYGCWVEGADTNGGAWFGGEFNGNKIAGVYDNSFLGCDWVACSTDGNVSGTYPTIVFDAGKTYAVVDPVLASTTQPTQANSYPRKPFTDSPVWVEYGTQGAPSTNIPQWTNGMTLYQGGGVILRGDSSKSTRHGGYDEGNQAYGYVSPNCSAQGGAKRMLGPGCAQQGGDWSGLSSISSAVYRALVNGTLALGFTFFNRAAGNSRVTRLAWAQGYLTDGVTEKTQVVVDGGKIGAVPSLAVSFNQGNDDNLLDLAFEVLGTVTKVFRPGVDSVWDFGSFARRWARGWFGNISLFPAAAVTPANNGEVTFQLTSNTSLTFKVKGSDGTVRSGSITLA